MTKITIIHTNCNPRKFKSRFSNSNVVWFSFGEDFNDIQKWDKELSSISKRLDIAQFMEEIYPDICKEYSDSVADLDIKFNDVYPEWWLSPVAEKNGWPPKFVVNECIVECVKKLLKKTENVEIILITSSVYNLVETKKIAFEKRLKYSICGHIYYFYELIALYVGYLFEFIYFGLEFISNKFWLNRYYKNGNSLDNIDSSNLILLRTYCHISSFKDDGEYINTNFGDLKKHLEQKGFDVIYQPNMSSISNKRKIYKWFCEKSIDRFWILEKYLSHSDLINAYFHTMKQFLMLHTMGHRVFLNLDALIVLTTGQNYLKSLLPTKLKQQKIEPSLILSDWENKAYEKYMCIQFKKTMPISKTVGYFGGVPFPTSPVVNLTPKEAKITPLPDKIVCCSQYVYDWLENVGFDKTKLIVGPSIRQNHVFDENMASDDFILVALPLNYDLSSELISEIVLFARRNEKIDVLLKPHPFLDISTIMQSNKPIPENISISNEDMSSLFQKCKYFVYTGPTTTACEAFVLGKDVCRYISNNHFSLDCLHFKFNDSIFNFTNHIELGEYIIEGHQTKSITTGVKYKEYIFNRMGADYADVFIT